MDKAKLQEEKKTVLLQEKCQKCDKVLFEHEIVYGTILVRCKRCGHWNKFHYNQLGI